MAGRASTLAPIAVRETERKYDADATFQLPRVSGLASQPHLSELTAVYHDTPDLRLLAAGVTLRRRVGGADEGWHLKLPGGPDTREEIRLGLDAGGGDGHREPPAALVQLVRVHSRGVPLAPVAELVTRRAAWRLSDDGHRELAELVDDEVAARTMGEQTTTRRWRELEVELVGAGSPADLDRIERRLVRAGATRSTAGSKLGRLLERPGTRGRAEHRSGRATAGEVVATTVRDLVDTLRALDPAVRRDQPDAVHRMRVTARRLRAILRGYGRVLDGRATREAVEELRWLGSALAAARDTEVMAERFGAALDELPDELVLGPVRAELVRELGVRSQTAREAALAALDGPRYLALQDRLDRLVADPPLARRAGRPARRELPRAVARSFARLDTRLGAALRVAPGDERDTALHAARKAAKRVRYVAEVSVPTAGRPAERLVKRVKKVQTLLGEHQDTVVARPVLRRLGAAAAGGPGRNGFTYGVLYGAERARAREVERELPRRWARARGKRVRSWLRSRS